MSSLNHFKSFFTFLLLKIKGKEPVRTGQCHQCGQCCRAFRVKSEGKWIKTSKQLDILVKQKPEYSRLIISGESEGCLDFTCSWLTQDGSCKDHENRLSICRAYPGTTRFYTGNKLPEHCGYVIKAAVPFEKVLQKKIRRMTHSN
ncbi:MAG: YkgJ family cysteine cluster protein [Candidatus Magnetomorum sp.]|nr:YkgJ family cysteine cluster protein [Candidatus Magnetomorum sp.]